MHALKAKLLKILDFIEDKNDVVFVDYPIYHNVGDLLIMLGTLDFFKNNDINVRLHLSALNLNLNKAISSKTTIICQGGGNFGDLYHTHQNVRERLVRSFPNNKIIILPQTAFFNSIENQQKSQKLFNKHDNVVMFARDKQTHELFKQFTNKAYLMPDMAHELYGTLPKSKVKEGTLYFLRNDIEKTPLPSSLQQEIRNQDRFDWNDLLTKNDHVAAYTAAKLIKINSKLKSNILDEIIFKAWEAHARTLASRMAKKFSSYERIITSRLHGHILSCLIDVPSVVIDNNYGKNSAYYNLWTKELGTTSLWEN